MKYVEIHASVMLLKGVLDFPCTLSLFNFTVVFAKCYLCVFSMGQRR